MAELKTKSTSQSVASYLDQITDETTRKDCLAICKLMEEITKSPANMWGPSIVGVGNYNYKYESGRTLDWFIMGFSPRKANISLYILGCEAKEREQILPRLGKHKTGKGCIYVKTLSDINMDVLRELCEVSYRNLRKES
jgi:hypothetical protein